MAKILIVEDKEENINALKRFLSDAETEATYEERSIQKEPEIKKPESYFKRKILDKIDNFFGMQDDADQKSPVEEDYFKKDFGAWYKESVRYKPTIGLDDV